jgi:hypothetical protein
MSNSPDYLIYKHELTEIKDEQINLFTTHGEFNELGVEILKEVNSLLITIASIYRADENGKTVPYTHEEAALIGNLVRYCKLSSGFLEQFTKKRAETSLIFFRCLSETYINLKYFLKYKDEHTLRHYIKHSLRQEKDLLEIIKRNVTSKEQAEHIEERMTNSIKNSFRASDFEEENVNNSTKWDGKVKARIKEIIDPDFYVLIYGSASHAVHGNWQDLITHHLAEENGGFLPDTSWTYPTLQLLIATTILSGDLLHNYVEEVIPNDNKKRELLVLIEDIIERTFKLDKAHELFIQRERQKGVDKNAI